MNKAAPPDEEKAGPSQEAAEESDSDSDSSDDEMYGFICCYSLWVIYAQNVYN